MSFRRKAKVDANQPKIVKALRENGAVVFHLHQLKNLFDILVAYKGELYCMEIKSNYKSGLTEGEKECKQKMESVAVPYYIVYTEEQALKIIGAI